MLLYNEGGRRRSYLWMQTRGKRVVAAVVIEDLIKLGIKSAQHKKSTKRKRVSANQEKIFFS